MAVLVGVSDAGGIGVVGSVDVAVPVVVAEAVDVAAGGLRVLETTTTPRGEHEAGTPAPRRAKASTLARLRGGAPGSLVATRTRRLKKVAPSALAAF